MDRTCVFCRSSLKKKGKRTVAIANIRDMAVFIDSKCSYASTDLGVRKIESSQSESSKKM